MLVFNFDTTFIHSIFYCLQRLVTQTGFFLASRRTWIAFQGLDFSRELNFSQTDFSSLLIRRYGFITYGLTSFSELDFPWNFFLRPRELGPQHLGHRELGPLGTWATENLGYCELGPLGPLGTWSTGNLGHLELGPLETWATLNLGHLELDTLGTWATGNLGHWELGPLEVWAAWNLGHLELGPPWTWATWNLAFSKLLPTSMLPKDLLRQRWEYCTGRPFFD